jgi:hypothetical protein
MSILPARREPHPTSTSRCVPKARGQEQRHLPGSDQIPLLGSAHVGPMSGKVFPVDGAFLLVRRNRSTVQADLETEIRLGISDQEGMSAFEPGHL